MVNKVLINVTRTLCFISWLFLLSLIIEFVIAEPALFFILFSCILILEYFLVKMFGIDLLEDNEEKDK